MADETKDERWQRLTQNRIDRPLPKRFYTQVSVGEDHTILLDKRGVKTPLKAKLILPNADLAAAIADEWRAQLRVINPVLMPLTKLVNTAIDRVSAERAHVAAEVKAFAGNDLVCYRADAPAALVALQAQAWEQILVWAERALGAKFITVSGVIHVQQDANALEAVAQRVATLNNYALTGVHNLMTLTGSALIALMMHARGLGAVDAWNAAHVDEDFQISQWGEDFEAVSRRAFRKSEFDATVRFLSLIDDSPDAT